METLRQICERKRWRGEGVIDTRRVTEQFIREVADFVQCSTGGQQH